MNIAHQKNIVDFEFINKFYVNNIYKIPHLQKIILRTSVRDSEYEQTAFFTKSLFLLEVITFQRSFVKNYKTFMKGKGQKCFSFNALVTLRNQSMYNFLYYFIHFILIMLKNNFLTINRFLDNNSYSFCLKDITIFPGVAEFFIKWPYPLFFTLILTSKNMFYLQFMLRNFAIFTFTKYEISE